MMIRSIQLSEYSVSSAGIVGSPKRIIRRSSPRSIPKPRRRRSAQRDARVGRAPVPKLPSRIAAAPSSVPTTSATVIGIVTITAATVSVK